MHLCKTKTKLADFKKPTYSKKVKKQYGEDESKYPETVTAEMKTRLSEWEAKTTAQAEKRKRIKELQQSQAIQDLMDLLYRWCAGPIQHNDPTRRPLQWSGTMNIHNCQLWWATDVCLYMTYPFVSSELYEVIYGIHLTIKLLLRVPVDRQALKDHRPILLETLKRYSHVIPENWHGILVHALTHILDSQIKKGAPALCLTMYIFERLVALFNRFIDSRLEPELNLIGNIDLYTGVRNAMYSYDSPSMLLSELSLLPTGLLKNLNIDATSICEDTTTNTPAKANIVPATTTSHNKINVSDLPIAIGKDTVLPPAQQVPELTEIHTAAFINGLSRRVVSSEPTVGSTTNCCRRYSHTHTHKHKHKHKHTHTYIYIYI